MKRSEFIKAAGLSILGISLFPSITFGSDDSLELIEIPNIKEHVRHGQFQLNISESNSLSSSIERHLFYKNGHSPSKEDMHILKLNLNNKSLIINQIDESVDIKYGKSSHTISLNKNNKINLDSETVLEFIQLDKGETISISPLKNNSYLIPISGKCNVNNKPLLSNALLFKTTTDNFIATQASSILIIHC